MFGQRLPIVQGDRRAVEGQKPKVFPANELSMLGLEPLGEDQHQIQPEFQRRPLSRFYERLFADRGGVGTTRIVFGAFGQFLSTLALLLLRRQRCRSKLLGVGKEFERQNKNIGEVLRRVQSGSEGQPKHIPQMQGSATDRISRPRSRLQNNSWLQEPRKGPQVVLTNFVPYVNPMFIREHLSSPPDVVLCGKKTYVNEDSFLSIQG